MKKMLALLVLVICLSCAFAEQNPVVFFDGNVYWISDSNLLRVHGKDGYFLTDVSGNRLTEEVYSSNFQHNHGLVSAYRIDGNAPNCNGVLDIEGQEVVPFEYGAVKMYEGKWVVAIKLMEATHDQYDFSTLTTSDVYMIDTVDIYNLKTGAMITLPRENYHDSYVDGDVINIEDRATGRIIAYDEQLNPIKEISSLYSTEPDPDLPKSFYQNGKYGVKKGDEIIVEPFYDRVYGYEYGYATVYMDDKIGLIDIEGVEILPAVYDEILTNYYLPVTEGKTGYNSDGYYAVVVDGKLGFATDEGVACEPKYAKAVMKNHGASAMLTDIQGNYLIIAADGVETIITGYEHMECLMYSGGFIYKVRDKENNYGLIDWHGIEIFPCQYNGFELSGDGNYVLVKVDYNRDEVYDLKQVWDEAIANNETDENLSVADLISHARKLYKMDSATAMELIDDAIELFASGNSAVNLLQGAKELIKTDAVAYEDAINLLLNSVVEKFK